jgi:predicted nucleic acid-binding protein
MLSFLACVSPRRAYAIARRIPAHAAAWLTALMKFGIREAAPSDPWLAMSLELTRRNQVSFYDAAYHALALTKGGVFVTADARYVERMDGAGGSPLT